MPTKFIPFATSAFSTRFAPMLLFIWLALTVTGLSQAPTAPVEVYFPAPGDGWEKTTASEAGFDPDLLHQAVDFALANESSGDRDLRLQIALSFHREPFDGIVGPTKERGDPSGLIIRHGYIVAEWGPTDRVDMTFRCHQELSLHGRGTGLGPGVVARPHSHPWL